ncbi:1-phosphofructokinase family hexose kinase [Microbispora siamensis]
MIVTITPNPSVDRTVFIDTLPRGAVIRSRRTRSEPSGKGVNVALALRAHGHDVVAVLPVGGAVGTQIVAMLDAADVPFIAVPITGEIRTNVSLAEPDGTVTKINEAGPALDPAEAEALAVAALERADGSTWLAGCGSLPAGLPEDFYAHLAVQGRRRGVKVAIDSSGAALRAALPGGPDLVKPNVHELADVVERPLKTLGDVIDAAVVLRQWGARSVLASLGADGAILLDDDGVLHGQAAVPRVVSAVGAGDALLAGFLAGGGGGRDALRNALTWAAAAVGHEGTLFSGADLALTVTIDDVIDRERHLTEPA